MREDLLHFVWKFKKFSLKGLNTFRGESLRILDLGTHNKHSGPDFLSARLEIDGQLWVGNVEIHVKSSDWLTHGHQSDPAYNNVILHVVWTVDKEIVRASGEPLPTLVLKDIIDDSLLYRYERFSRLDKSKFILCENHLSSFPLFILLPWMEKVYRERLAEKTAAIDQVLNSCNGDWERTLFIFLFKSFGQKTNEESFFELGCRLDYSLVRRFAHQPIRLESLLFGLSGLLFRSEAKDDYHSRLIEEYKFLCRTFGFEEIEGLKIEFMGVRPLNFPTIRLSQFATLMSSQKRLFSKIIATQTVDEIYKLLDVGASAYWNTHYTFGRPSAHRVKVLSSSFKDSILINTLIPIKYVYAREQGKADYEEIRDLVSQVAAEKNRIIDRYLKIGFPVENALDSQALLQLYKYYCQKNRCLECALGNHLLN